MAPTISEIFSGRRIPRAPPYTSAEAKQYHQNLYLDNSCLNIVQETPEQCLEVLTVCGKLVIAALQKHNIQIEASSTALFKLISCDALLKAILNKIPHDYIDFFATLNLQTNEVCTFSTASCLAGFLERVPILLIPSGIITLNPNFDSNTYLEYGEEAFTRIKNETRVVAMKQWSENNPLFSSFWDINIKRILAPFSINPEALTNWIASRKILLQKPHSKKLAYALHLATSSPEKAYPDPPANVIILTKNNQLPKNELTKKICCKPTVRITTLKTADLAIMTSTGSLLVSRFSNPALLHPLRIFAISKSKRVLDLALRLYKAKIIDIQEFITAKPCKAYNSAQLVKTIFNTSSSSTHCHSRVAELLNEAASLPLERSEHLYKSEVHKIVRDLTVSGSLNTLLTQLFKTINTNEASPNWADILIKITKLDKSDAKFVKNYCAKNGLALSLSDLIETTLLHTTWNHDENPGLSDQICPIPAAKILSLKHLNSDHDIVKGLVVCFCQSLTNNVNIELDIAKLLPTIDLPPPNATHILLSDSDEDERIKKIASSTLKADVQNPAYANNFPPPPHSQSHQQPSSRLSPILVTDYKQPQK
ncbi:unnamed protein product [Oikopleura dioica]|uniref:Uncharacterized protein n=1 Tax=Oikopleura dioica TaxID=34765 RepID=E4XP19_OIKDI|nr:unnamed protein product [Oikopleura dioica]